MEKYNELIELIEKNLKELKQSKEKNQEEQSFKDIVVEKLNKIEEDISIIKKNIIG